jgi:glycosyltransferase involved in cell wall biosynthesis
MSPPSGGGGHQNIFRFIEHLDSLGFRNNVYIYSTVDDMTLAQAKENVSAYCHAKKLAFYRYKGSMAVSDIVFATGWETAYPVFNDKTNAYKMYFVQDFEPYFYPVGTDYVLAENTYRFGFHGVTAGGFLRQKLGKEFGMRCDHFDFGADTKLYRHENHEVRKEVFFYARPVTERRGFDLGIMALELFHQQRPDYTINLAGWDVSGYDIPFPYINHKALRLDQLSDLYNQCAAALVISLTNLSLLPLELMLCGTIPVVNDGDNNRLVSNNPNIVYSGAAPAALAKAMIGTVDRKDLVKHATQASASVGTGGWSKSLAEFEKVINGVLK